MNCCELCDNIYSLILGEILQYNIKGVSLYICNKCSGSNEDIINKIKNKRKDLIKIQSGIKNEI